MKSTPDTLEFFNRLRKNWKVRKKWAQSSQTSVYRIYDRDIPQFPFVVDRLGTVIVLGSYSRDPLLLESITKRPENFAELGQILGADPQDFVFRQRIKQKGLQQYERLSEDPLLIDVQENGLFFELNLTQYLDVGLFIDHRKSRAALIRWAHGKICLNLFCYTGSISVALAAGGAKQVDSVDMSKTYLSWAQRNFLKNSLSPAAHGFLHADILSWLKEQQLNKGIKYDFIFLDPPSFSNSKRMEGTFDVQRDQRWVLQKTADLLTPDGLIAFSNNHSAFKLEEKILPGFLQTEATSLTHSKDFVARPAHRSFFFSRSQETLESYTKLFRQLGPEF